MTEKNTTEEIIIQGGPNLTKLKEIKHLSGITHLCRLLLR